MSPAEVDPCVRRLVDAHFRGDIAAESERRMRAHLPRCATCRGYYERHLVLEKLDPAARVLRGRSRAHAPRPRS
jgi:predicted anti-sigma-YlaC factor YlaD